MTQHHLLIGPPGSGKTTLALALQQHLPHSEVISTDAIRQDLYGDPAIQGNWSDIFTQVQRQFDQWMTQGKTIIYDATNAKRPWRFSVLRPFLETYPDQTWVGWHLTTPLQTCLDWNQQRDRQVPEAVIQNLYQALQTFPPEPAEGMVIVEAIDPSQHPNLAQHLTVTLPKFQRRVTNQKNATKHGQKSFHAYSDLLAFERLLYLVKLLLASPGAGQLRYSHPDRLQVLLGEATNLSTLVTDLDELSALLSLEHPIYGDRFALIQNLDWLHRNGFLSATPCPPHWDLPEQAPPLLPTHGYAEVDRFLRLMGTLRFILHHPFYEYETEGSALEALTHGLRNHNIVTGFLGSCQALLRKDIQLIFKPYELLHSYRYKQGYFLGTGIFSHSQLLRLHQFLAGQAKSLADPTVLDLFTTLGDRLQSSKISSLHPYPVRALYNFTITNQSYLPDTALAKTIDRLEQEIEQGQCLELQRFAGVGSHGTEPEKLFQAWPVQIVFHNIGWYLGYEVASGDKKGLLAFQRLDRLFRGYQGGIQRDRKAQEQACQHLQKLFQASGGLFLGTEPKHQQQWLNGTLPQRKQISVILELWCNDRSFRFICEGDQRFPLDQIKFSPRLPDSSRPGHPRLFRLKPTGDPIRPHRFQVTLPYWALEGIDLQRWIWGFKDQVQVVSPPELVKRIREEVNAIGLLYGSDPLIDEMEHTI